MAPRVADGNSGSSSNSSSSSSSSGLLRCLDRYFEVSRRGSTFGTEVRGGCASFLTMSYILLVNPQILGAWARGTDVHPQYISDIATATSLTCGIGCILTGTLSRLPFAVGPGMGLNTLFAALCVAACHGGDCRLQRSEEAFGMAATTTFVMGAIIFVLSLLNATNLVLLMLPGTLKTAIMVGIGAFQAFVGIRWMEIIVPAPPGELVQLESIGNGLNFDPARKGEPTSGYAQLLFVLCLITMSALFRRGVKGSMLIAITLTTAISWVFEIGGGEAVWPFDVPNLARSAGLVDVAGWLQSSRLSSNMSQMLVMFMITIFDVGGVQFGIGKAIDLPEAKRKAAVEANVRAAAEGREVDDMYMSRVTDSEILPGRSGQLVYACVGVSTMVSAALGCSPCIVFLECAAGVREGAKTGVASVVTGLLFLAATFFTPVFQHVPNCASAAPLVFVGCLMMGPVGEIDWNDLNRALPAFLCILMMPFSGSVTWGIVFGLACYVLLALASPMEMISHLEESEMKQILSPPASPDGTDYVEAQDDAVSQNVSVARLKKLESTGQLALIEELVPQGGREEAPSPMDELHRVSRAGLKRAGSSVVTKALIGSPH